MSTMLHRFPDDDGFERPLQLAQLRYSPAPSGRLARLAENYVGLPFDVTGP